MLIARILLILVIFSVAICLGAYLVKGDKRYLRLIGQIVKYAFLLLLAGAVVMAIARIILV
jgi:phosphate uptake regulator